MNKRCKNCGADVPEGANFCQSCGGADFVFASGESPMNVDFDENQTQLLTEEDPLKFDVNPVQQQPQPIYNQAQTDSANQKDTHFDNNGYYNTQPQPTQLNQAGTQFNGNVDYNTRPQTQQQFNNQNTANSGWQPSVSPNQPKKKSKKGLIIGISVGAAVVVLTIIGIIVVGIITESNSYDDYYDDDYYYEDYADDEPIVEYTEGYFDGSVYTNEWADIELALPVGFSNGSEEEYANYKNSTTDCGLLFTSDTEITTLAICFEKLPSYPIYDEESYLDQGTENADSNSYGVTFTPKGDYSFFTIGGQVYTKAVYTVDNGYNTYEQCVYVRKIDNYMIGISLLGTSETENDEIVEQITQINWE